MRKLGFENLTLVIHINLQVIFRNEQSGEYLFYYVTFKAVPPGVMATIDLSTPIRKSTSHVVTLHNPLSTPVTFNSQCSVADIQLPPSFTVPPLSEVGIASVSTCQAIFKAGTHDVTFHVALHCMSSSELFCV